MVVRDMETIVLNSRLIASASYDEDNRILRVEFHDGRIRTVTAPRVMYENLITAGSPGWYYTRHISPFMKS
jgi:hypothetical protein